MTQKLSAYTETPSLYAQVDKTVLTDDTTIITVGSGGDYATITAAIAYARNNISPNGHTLTIRLMTGFVIEECLTFKDDNLGWISITSVDAQVSVSAAAVYAGTLMLLYALRSNCPAWGILCNVNMTGVTAGVYGLILSQNSYIFIASGCGVKGFTTGQGVQIQHNSRCQANGSVFTGNSINVLVMYSGNFTAESGVFTGHLAYGVRCQGAMAYLVSSNCRRAGSDTTADISTTYGGVIYAGAATGGVSQTANVATIHGIIFK